MNNKNEHLNFPIISGIINNVKKNELIFHMPGHKRDIFPIDITKFGISNEIDIDNIKSFLNIINSLFKIDITELDSTDDLHNPQNYILESENLLSKKYESIKSFYLTGGSTLGILTSIKSIANPNDTILIEKNSHKSVFNISEILGLKIIIVDKINLDAISTLKNEKINIAVFTNPSYDGNIEENIDDVIHQLKEKNIFTILDAAHSAHFQYFQFIPKFNKFLENMKKFDFVIQSLHKTLPSINSSALLHVFSKNIYIDEVRRSISMFETSSPLYPIVMSCELSALIPKSIEITIGQKYIKQYNNFIKKTKRFKNIKIISNDPLKIIFINNYPDNILEILLQQNQISFEFANEDIILLIANIYNPEQLIQLYTILQKIDLVLDEYQKVDNNQKKINKPLLRKQTYNFYELKNFESEYIKIENSLNRISLEYYTPYPPGIPLVIPGEIINENILNNLKKYKIKYKNKNNEIVYKKYIKVKKIKESH